LNQPMPMHRNTERTVAKRHKQGFKAWAICKEFGIDRIQLREILVKHDAIEKYGGHIRR